MANDLEQLVNDFHDYFINLYRQSSSEPDADDAFLAFESIGTALTPSMFALGTGEYSPLLALEQFSTLANTLPVLDGHTITTPSIRTVDGLYDLMVTSAIPDPNGDRGPFDVFRSKAVEAFDRAKVQPLLASGVEYRPAVATPPDWCAPQGASAWTSKTFGQTEETGSPSDEPRPPLSPVRIPSWKMRVLSPGQSSALESATFVQRAASPAVVTSLQPNVQVRPVAQASMATRIAAQARVNPAMNAVAVGRPETAVSFVVPLLVTSASANAAANRVVATSLQRPAVIGVQPDTLGALTQPPNTATARDVTAKSLSLSFDYCLVNIARPWMLTEFMTLKGWYMAGSKAGELSSGSGDGSAPFDVVPVAALAVRNLTIKAKWSHDDQVAINSAVSLGPFSLRGRKVDEATGTLTAPGVQIIAWVCQPMTALPPSGDPALVTAGGGA